MNNLSKEKKQQLAVVALLTVAILFGLWFGLVSTQRKSRAGIRSKTAEVTKKVDRAKAVTNRREEIEAELEQAIADLRAREAHMPSVGDEYLWFLQVMKQARAGFDVSLPGGSVNPTQPQDVTLIPKFPYRAVTFPGVKLTAKYEEFGKFLANFENEWPHVRVQNLQAVPSMTAAGEEKLDFTFDVIALVLTNAVVVR